MTKYQDIAMMLEANAITNTVDAYEQGRVDAICEVNEKMNDFKEKAIEAYGVFICEACADAFTDMQEWILSQMKEGTND